MSHSSPCCAPLQIGTIFIAICEIVTVVAAFIASTGGLIYFEQYRNEALQMFVDPPTNLEFLKPFINLENLGSTSLRVVLIFSMLYWLQRSVLGVILLSAVFKRDRVHLQVWVVYSIILLTVNAVAYLVAILFGLFGLMSIPVYVALFCVREYSICFVSSYEKRFCGSSYLKTLNDW